MTKKKILLLILAALVVFLVLLVAFTFVNKGGQLTPMPSPTPTPLSIEELIASPSAWVTDEAILKIEKDLGILEKDLDTVDLDELRLRPPVLDLKVEY